MVEMDLVGEKGAMLGQGEEYSWETEEKLREKEIREDMQPLRRQVCWLFRCTFSSQAAQFF